MKRLILLLFIFTSCTSRSEKIDKRLIVLNGYRDSLNIQYRLLQIVNDSLKQTQANARGKFGKPDSTTAVRFFENEQKIKFVLNESNTVSKQIEELELVK